MSKPQVTLTFAGDADQLTKTFDQVGQSAKSMGDDVAATGKSFDQFGETTDTVDTRAMGFRDTVTGVQDSVKGFGMILKGEFGYEALVTAGMGVGDLASGFTNLLVPAMKSAVTWLKTTRVWTLATAAASGIAAVAKKVWAGAQWLLNAALTANPIGIIIVAVTALVAIIVLIATKTTWFQDLWRVTWTWVKKTALDFWDWIKTLPEKLGAVFAIVGDYISRPFKAAFNFISDAWNNTIGKLRWTVPSWVPLVGGKSIAAPQLPKFHAGGVVPGVPGQEVLGVLQAGERVSARGASGAPVLELRSSGRDVDDFVAMIIRRIVKTQGGGDVQLAFGGR